MYIFEVKKIILNEKIDDDVWVFVVSDIFHLSHEQYAKNEAYNDSLGDYEPEKELPTNSVATIKATSSSGDSVELYWSSGAGGIYPHISKKGWSKGLFIKLNNILKKWRWPNA